MLQQHTTPNRRGGPTGRAHRSSRTRVLSLDVDGHRSPALRPGRDSSLSAGEDDANPFSGTKGTRELGMQPKSEPESFYEERPWTPNTGEDFLLCNRQNNSFYPSAAIYPRRQSRAERFVGARRAAYNPVQHERDTGQMSDHAPSSSQSPAPRLKPIPFQKIAPLRDDGFMPIQKPQTKVLLKDHARLSMSEYAGLHGPAFSFASLALTLESELIEFKNDPVRRGEARPSIQAAEMSLELLGRIIERPGPFQKVLMLLHEQLTESIFAHVPVPQKDNTESPSRTPSGRQDMQRPVPLPGDGSSNAKTMLVPFFQLYETARTELQKHFPPEEEETENNRDSHFPSAVESPVLGSPNSTVRSLGSPASKSAKKKEPSAEEKMFEKVLELQEEKFRIEERMQDMSVQANMLEEQLEEQGRQLEHVAQESTELKGSFLRMKASYHDARSELELANKHNDTHFKLLQDAVSRREHDRVVAEYQMQLEAQSAKNRELLEETFGQQGPQLDDMMKSMTPRPNWRRTGASKQILVDCSIFARTDTSTESVDKLVQGFLQMHERLSAAQAKLQVFEGTEDDDVPQETSWNGMEVTHSAITCMGIGDDVPEFLRFNGQVRNLKMRKGHAERDIRLIWAAKAEHDKEMRLYEKPMSTMVDFFMSYTRAKFNSIPKHMAEWTYNLIVALRENINDTDCDLFLKILMNELSEDVYHDEMEEMEDALYLAEETDRAENKGKKTGKVEKENFLIAIRERFGKTYEEMVELKKSLDVAYGDKALVFMYADLFEDDRDFSQNEFAEEFREQSIVGRKRHTDQLKKLVASSRQANGDKLLVLDDFKTGLRMLDPAKTNNDIDIYLRRGSQVAYGDLPETIEPEAFLHNMFSRGVCKMGTLARIERKEVLSLAALQKSMYSAPDTPDDLQGRG